MKNLIGRFNKDVDGFFTTLIILGIIIKEERVWSYQIKNLFKKIKSNSEEIPTSTFYSNLNKLEADYGLIYSEKDESVQRRYYLPTKLGKQEFSNLKNYWLEMVHLSNQILENL